MSDLVSENKSLAEKVKNKEKGYRLMQLDDIIEEYNYWYDEKGPADIEYLAEKIEAKNNVKIDSDKEVQILSTEVLSDYLSNKIWETTKITQFNSANPDGVTRSSQLKQARTYFTLSFDPKGNILIEGNSPYKGKYDR